MSQIFESTPSITIGSNSSKLPTSNSHSHSVQITTICLNENNFLKWSQFVQMYIRGRGKIGYLTDNTKEPTKMDHSYATWDVENSMIMAWLVNSMEGVISSNYMCFHPTAKALWDNIIQMYSNLGNQSQIYELQLKLGNNCQGENSVTKYFNVLRGLWQDLDLFNDYEWKNTDDCNYFKKVVESSQIIKFLVGLNVEFDEVRDRIIGRQPLTYLGEVLSEVRREESRRNVMLGKKLFGPVENSTLLGTTATASHNPNNQHHPDDKPRV